MTRNANIRTAIVTGASAGIGRELVRQLASHPKLAEIQIIATARRGDRLDSLAAEFPAGRVLPYVADITDPAQRKALMEWARERFDRLDLIVNNAGAGTYAEFEKTQPEAVRNLIALDVEAVIDLTARAIEWMKPAGKGQIVQVSSILGEVGLPYSAVYVAAKHAVNGLVKSVRYELAGSGVSVWAACPGQTVSEFRAVAGSGLSNDVGRGAESTEKVVASIVREILRGGRRAQYYPTWQPWTISTVAWAAPWAWDRIMQRYRKTAAAEDLGIQDTSSR